MASDLTLKLDGTNFDQEVIKSELPVLVDFWATWCPPCRMIGPMIDEIAQESAGKYRVGKVNHDENQQLSARFGVQALPSLLLFKGGELKEKLVGARGKKELVAKLEALAVQPAVKA